MCSLAKKFRLKSNNKATRTRVPVVRDSLSDQEEAENSEAFDAFVKKHEKGARAMRASRSENNRLFHFEDDGADIGEWTDIDEDFAQHARRSRSASKQKMLQKWNENTERVMEWYFESLEAKGSPLPIRVSASFEPAQCACTDKKSVSLTLYFLHGKLLQIDIKSNNET